jgi:hypothetical protein
VALTTAGSVPGMSAKGGQASLYLSFCDAATTSIAEVEPLNVHQVFQAHPLPDGSGHSLKTSDDHYVSCDKFGAITADKVAVGKLEEWRVVHKEDGFAIEVREPVKIAVCHEFRSSPLLLDSTCKPCQILCSPCRQWRCNGFKWNVNQAPPN